jgi:hypothetical protein
MNKENVMTRIKRLFVSIALFLSTLAVSDAARADHWECVASGSSSSSPAASCYVSYVRFYPGSTPYVKVKLHDPRNRTSCNYMRVKVNTGGSGPASIEEVRGSLAVLLTAMTTGLPIKFWRLTAHGSSSDCVAGTVIIAKPGH